MYCEACNAHCGVVCCTAAEEDCKGGFSLQQEVLMPQQIDDRKEVDCLKSQIEINDRIHALLTAHFAIRRIFIVAETKNNRIATYFTRSQNV